MNKYERIVRIPAVVINEQLAQRVEERLDALAEEKITSIIVEKAHQFYNNPGPQFLGVPVQGLTEDAFVLQAVQHAPYRSLMRSVHGAKYTYLSPHGSVQFVGEDYGESDVPKDLLGIIAESTGQPDRMIQIHLMANPQPLEMNDPNLNRILIQSSMADRAWVNDVYERFRQEVDSERNLARDLVYKYRVLFVWLTFSALLSLEYEIAQWATGYSWAEPLNGLQVLFVFVVLFLDLIAAAQFFNRAIPYAYPYFEVVGNLSRKRIAMRSLVALTLVSVYGSAVVAPLWHRIVSIFR